MCGPIRPDNVTTSRDKLKRAGQCLANIFASKVRFKDLKMDWHPTKPGNLSELRR